MASPSARVFRWTRAGARAGRALLLALAPVAAQAAGPPSALGIYEFVLNGQVSSEPVLGRMESGSVAWVEERSLVAVGVRLPPDARRLQADGGVFVRLDTVPGASVSFDAARQSLSVDLSPEMLAGTRLGTAAVAHAAARAAWGGFLNYALVGEWSESAGDTNDSIAGLVELGLFGGQGTGLATFAVNPYSLSGRDSDLVRLDTYWRRDDLEAMRTLVIGDTYSRPGVFGRPVRFGGIQFGRNFSVQPGFVRYPRLAVNGLAAMPSTVEVFLDNQLQSSNRVDAGPFTYTGLPVVNGAGEVQVVVRDMFGQEQVLTESLYGSPTLLAAGVSDYTLSVGAVRRDYGIRSASYGDYLLSWFARRGLSDRTTVEHRVEATRGTTTASVAVDQVVGTLGLVQLGAAASRSNSRSGHAFTVVFERASRDMTLRGHLSQTSDDFGQPGDDPDYEYPRRAFGASLGMRTPFGGSLGAVVLQRENQAGQRTRLASLSYSDRIGNSFIHWSAGLTRISAEDESTSFHLSVSIPLGPGKSASAQVRHRDGANGSDSVAATQFHSAQPAFGTGAGYRLYADSKQRKEASVQAVLPKVQAGLDAFHDPELSVLRARVEGGVGLLQDHVFVSRPIRDSFAVVSLEGLPNVRVRQENQLVGVTDANGRLVLPRTLPYVENRVSIDPESVPIGVSVESVKREFVARWRSGAWLEFGARRERTIVTSIVEPDGAPVAVGSEVAVVGTQIRTVVGYDGRVFLAGLPEREAVLEVRSASRACTIRLPAGSATERDIPELGPYVCQLPRTATQ